MNTSDVRVLLRLVVDLQTIGGTLVTGDIAQNDAFTITDAQLILKSIL